LTPEEVERLRSQFATSKTGPEGSRNRPYVYTEQGLARRLNELEKKYDSRFRVVFEAIRELMAEPEPKVKRIGFKA
jgi:hypothetical protein